MWKSALEWTFARLNEPSGYAGIAGVVASMSFLPDARSYAAEIMTWGVAIAGFAAIILKQKRV